MTELQPLEWLGEESFEFGSREDTVPDPSPVPDSRPARDACLSARAAEDDALAGTAVDAPIVPAPRRDDDSSRHQYRVRLMRFDRPDSRTFLVRCTSEAVARAHAGWEWRIVRVDLV